MTCSVYTVFHVHKTLGILSFEGALWFDKEGMESFVEGRLGHLRPEMMVLEGNKTIPFVKPLSF